MRFLSLIFLLTLACSSLPKEFEKERRGIRHTASNALYPRVVGNYSYLNHDEHQALSAFENGKSTALYLDYKSGGQMTSILYRPFAKIETYHKPKKMKFDAFVARELHNMTEGHEVIFDTTGKNKAGTPYRQVKMKSDQAFLSEGFSGVGFHEKLPAITKLVFLDKGDNILFMTTSYPANDEETHARPNTEFVAKFLEAQK